VVDVEISPHPQVRQLEGLAESEIELVQPRLEQRLRRQNRQRPAPSGPSGPVTAQRGGHLRVGISPVRNVHGPVQVLENPGHRRAVGQRTGAVVFAVHGYREGGRNVTEILRRGSETGGGGFGGYVKVFPPAAER